MIDVSKEWCVVEEIVVERVEMYRLVVTIRS